MRTKESTTLSRLLDSLQNVAVRQSRILLFGLAAVLMVAGCGDGGGGGY